MWTKVCSLFLYVETHWITTLATLVLGAGATSFIYQVGGDVVEGRWSSSGVSLYIHSVPIERGEPIYIFYASPDLAAGDRLIVPVELAVNNDSEKAAKRVVLSLRYPKGSDRQLIPEEVQAVTGSASPKDVTFDVNANDEFVYVNHRMSYMPPKDHMNFSDGAFSVRVDRAGMSYLSFPAGLDIKASLSSEASASEDWDLRYRAVLAKNISQLQEWVRFDYGQRIARELREREGFVKYFWGWLLSKKVYVYGLYPRFRYDGESRTYFPGGGKNEYKVFRFIPYSRDLLFDGS